MGLNDPNFGRGDESSNVDVEKRVEYLKRRYSRRSHPAANAARLVVILLFVLFILEARGCTNLVPGA